MLRLSISLLASVLLFSLSCTPSEPLNYGINGKRCLQLVSKQITFGQRLPGSDASVKCMNWLADEANKLGFVTSVDSWNSKVNGKNKFFRNLICTRAAKHGLLSNQTSMADETQHLKRRGRVRSNIVMLDDKLCN